MKPYNGGSTSLHPECHRDSFQGALIYYSIVLGTGKVVATQHNIIKGNLIQFKGCSLCCNIILSFPCL